MAPHNLENFQQFSIKWNEEQNSNLQQLIAALKTSPQDPSLHDLVNRVTSHYEEYYRIKSNFAQSSNILHILSPQWTSPLEDAFLWIGGWRPSTAFHLLYSVSGLQLEFNFELTNRVETGDLGDLSSAQVGKIDALQRRTLFEEKEITREMAVHQEKVACVEMVELSREVSASIRMHRKNHCEKRLDSTLLLFKEGFKMILQNADDLRLRTLKGIMDILSPKQGVHFLIAAAELHLRVHDWGKREEKKSSNNGNN